MQFLLTIVQSVYLFVITRVWNQNLAVTNRALRALSTATETSLDITVLKITVQKNQVNGYDINGCLDTAISPVEKYSAKIKYSIANTGAVAFEPTSGFVGRAACNTPAITKFLQLNINGGKDGSGNAYPINLERFATCVIDDSDNSNSCTSQGPQQRMFINQGGSYGVSKDVVAKFPLTSDQYDALTRSGSLTFTLSVNSAISLGVPGVASAIDGSQLSGVTWKALDGTFHDPIDIFIKALQPTAAPSTVPQTTTAPIAATTAAPTAVPQTTLVPTASPTTPSGPAACAVGGYAKTIGSATVSGYSNDQTLSSVCLTSDVTSIALGAFSGSDAENEGPVASITSIYIPPTVVTIGDFAFKGTPLTTLTFPGAVGTIGESAFNSCPLTSVTFGGNVGTINFFAFGLNYQLTSLTFPGTVDTIVGLAFCFCTSLTTVTFGGAVTNLGYDVFLATSLQDVYYPASWDIPKDKFPFSVRFHAV